MFGLVEIEYRYLISIKFAFSVWGSSHFRLWFGCIPKISFPEKFVCGGGWVGGGRERI